MYGLLGYDNIEKNLRVQKNSKSWENHLLKLSK